jgi:hypothetical protein
MAIVVRSSIGRNLPQCASRTLEVHRKIGSRRCRLALRNSGKAKFHSRPTGAVPAIGLGRSVAPPAKPQKCERPRQCSNAFRVRIEGHEWAPHSQDLSSDCLRAGQLCASPFPQNHLGRSLSAEHIAGTVG